MLSISPIKLPVVFRYRTTLKVNKNVTYISRWGQQGPGICMRPCFPLAPIEPSLAPGRLQTFHSFLQTVIERSSYSIDVIDGATVFFIFRRSLLAIAALDNLVV